MSTALPLPVVIVGAGLSGLVCAQKLLTSQRPLLVIDKGRSAGGRMATRRIGAGVCDHGAQFFSVRDPRFEALVQDWLAAGVAKEWCRGFQPTTGSEPADGYPRYAGYPGMTAIAKHLAQGLDVRYQARAQALRRQGSGWQIELEGGESLAASALVLTPPIPQTLALLETSQIDLPANLRQALEHVAYEPCLVVMAVLDGASAIPAPGAVQIRGEPLAWIADNQQKGISPHAATVTLHAGPGFSQSYWNAGDDEVSALLLDAAAPWLGQAQVTQVEVKRWRYSRPAGMFSTPSLALSADPPLILAGDAFGGPRLEGAALSGLAAAEALLALA